MFSVVIPLYNKEKSVGNTIRSVLAQSFQDFELLVINDGSTDSSRAVVAAVKDNRIRIVDKANGGISSSRNEGIKSAKHELVAFLDADDLWEPDFLETINRLVIDYPDADCYTTGYACKYNDIILNTFGARERGIIRDFFRQVYDGPVMHSSSVCVRKEVFERIGYFDTAIRRGEDYEMWARMGRSVSIAATPEVKVGYRLNTENRAMSVLHSPGALWLYYIPDESCRDRDQKRYYRRFLHRQVLEYLVKGKFKWAWQIAARNWQIASWYSYFCFPSSIQFRQFVSWFKLRSARAGENRKSSGVSISRR